MPDMIYPQLAALAEDSNRLARLLLADEPTGNLDPHTSGGVFAALVALVRAEGLSALIATHNMALAAQMDRALILDNGRLSVGRVPAAG